MLRYAYAHASPTHRWLHPMQNLVKSASQGEFLIRKSSQGNGFVVCVHDDGECVDKLLKRNLFQAGVLVLEPFRTKYLYQSNTYQCIHENEGLFNSLFRRFCLKHPTTVEQADRRRTKETRTGRHSKRQTKTIEHRLNLPEFFELVFLA